MWRLTRGPFSLSSAVAAAVRQWRVALEHIDVPVTYEGKHLNVEGSQCVSQGEVKVLPVGMFANYFFFQVFAPVLFK